MLKLTPFLRSLADDEFVLSLTGSDSPPRGAEKLALHSVPSGSPPRFSENLIKRIFTRLRGHAVYSVSSLDFKGRGVTSYLLLPYR